MNILEDTIDFERYFDENQDEGAKVRPASEFADAVIDRLYGQGSQQYWLPTGFQKTEGKFELRDGEVTLWAGVNKHGKTTLLSQVMLAVMRMDKKVCIASVEMKPAESMAKMVKQAAGVDQPSVAYIRDFHRWTDGRLWIYNHLGRLATKRVLAVATYVRKVLGIDHLVLDSLMKFGIGVEDLTGQKDFVDALCTIARDTGLHIHLVCHMRKGENERTAPGKFDVKGAGEITDLVDNIVIVWKNLRKPEQKEGEPLNEEPDSYVRVAGQRNFPWEGSFAFWFNKDAQQYVEHFRARPTYLDIAFLKEAA